jgi:hypothetical protein
MGGWETLADVLAMECRRGNLEALRRDLTVLSILFDSYRSVGNTASFVFFKVSDERKNLRDVDGDKNDLRGDTIG